MKKTVFYSWQSDLPNATNRGFIQTALEAATDAITADDTVEVEPVVDRDTQGVSGSPEISATIFKKIEEADMFVADISIIGHLSNNRPIPNPNVLIELGYALKTMGYDRVIMIFNLAYGSLTDLPFDLRTRRIMTYEMPAEATEKAAERKKLSKALQQALTCTLIVSNEPQVITPLFETATAAIENQLPNRIIKLRQELKAFIKILEDKAPLKFSEGGSINNLVESLNNVAETIAAFARLSHIIAIMNDTDAAFEVHKWFGNIIERYDLPKDYQGRYIEEDFDYYKFLGQELYTILIGSLLKEEKWRIIQKLLSEWIPVNYMRPIQGPMNATYKDVSEFVRSLHEEGKRRSRISLQADLIKEHFKHQDLSQILSFNEYMEADLFMFIVVELPPEKPNTYYLWRPISILYMRHTPSILLKAQRTNYAEFLTETCGIKTIETLKQRMLMRLIKINDLFAGNLIHWPIKNDDIERIGTYPS